MYLRNEGKKISPVKHVIIPTLSSITLVFAIVIAIDFDLSAPYVYAIYGSIVWIAVIIVESMSGLLPTGKSNSGTHLCIPVFTHS